MQLCEDDCLTRNSRRSFTYCTASVTFEDQTIQRVTLSANLAHKHQIVAKNVVEKMLPCTVVDAFGAANDTWNGNGVTSIVALEFTIVV